jgi:hypothetical protein
MFNCLVSYIHVNMYDNMRKIKGKVIRTCGMVYLFNYFVC